MRRAVRNLVLMAALAFGVLSQGVPHAAAEPAATPPVGDTGPVDWGDPTAAPRHAPSMFGRVYPPRTQAARSRDGYGAFGIAGRTRRAHRLSFEDASGPIPAGVLVTHRCDNRLCVRPSHLKLGTARDNAQDAVARGRMSPPVYRGDEWYAVHRMRRP